MDLSQIAYEEQGIAIIGESRRVREEGGVGSPDIEEEDKYQRNRMDLSISSLNADRKADASINNS